MSARSPRTGRPPPRPAKPPAAARPGRSLGLAADDLWRALVVIVVSAVCAVLVVDYTAAPAEPLEPGDVAEYTFKAPFPLTFPDMAGHERARFEAQRNELPVFVHDQDMVEERIESISLAFSAGRAALAEAGGREGQAPAALAPEAQLRVERLFLEPLRVQVRESDVVTLLQAGFPTEAEHLARELLRRAMADHLILLSRDLLPHDRGAIRVIHLRASTRTEDVVADFQPVLVPDEARQRITLGLLEAKTATGPLGRGAVAEAAGEIARALVTANLQYDPLETQERQAAAASALQMNWVSVKRGQVLFRVGEIVTEADLDIYRHFQTADATHQWWVEVLSIGLFFVLLLGTLYHFVTYAPAGASRPLGTRSLRDLWTMGALLVLVAVLARVTVAASEWVAGMIGYGAEAASVWFAVPLAGAVMLVRVLLGGTWTFAFSVAAAIVCGLVMEQQALPIAYFVITGVGAASAVEDARERITVVRAGAWVGLVGAIAVLLIHLVQLFVVDADVILATPVRPFWSMVFAFAGGLGSAFLVLSLVPVLESFGYVTDYRMMELANLDHPLLRQLMLRAPGSYHHSVIVGSLSEAGARAIGANALLARVASYFHDVGKSDQPQYFVENQHSGVNKHTHLDPFTSAHVIIHHVVEGGRLAREHRLPQPIIDNIYMHHGTGILQYFYEAACAQAADRSLIDEAAFRYPGPKPNTREAGVIMLADKVEAATRTLKVPDEGNIRSMIGRIVSSVIADGQLSECPLTFAEIQTVTETFVGVLVGIYHQRVEYPSTADVSRAGHGAAAGTITLEIVPAPAHDPPPVALSTPLPAPNGATEDLGASEDLPEEDTDVVDYESLDYLPRRG